MDGPTKSKQKYKKVPGWSPDGPQMIPGWSEKVEKKVGKKSPDGPQMVPG